MPKFRIQSNINIEHYIDADNEDEAKEIFNNQIELPTGYVESSCRILSIEPICEHCEEPMEYRMVELDDHTTLVERAKCFNC